jgi:malate dehydrogenase (oxaloacetate-decarboxylating)
LPITLDVGTNNEKLRNDPLYLGARHPRIEGEEYDRFIETFVLGVRRNFPGALIQWEDFAKHKAFKLLNRYRDRVLSFDDDIQGTGSTCCAALLTAMRIKQSSFKREQFVIVGFGQAGLGTAWNIKTVLKEEGLSSEELRSHIWPVDKQGLLFDDDPTLDEYQRPFAQPRAAVAGWTLDDPNKVTLRDVVRNAKATVLIGVTAQPGLFDHDLLTTMGANTPRPVIIALSNPTAKSECVPADAMAATNGRALMATGSPFKPVELGGRSLQISQCNNLYIFPGVGLGALVARAAKVTDRMFTASAKALSASMTKADEEHGLLLPPMRNIREVSFQVALAVAKEARDAGLGRLLSDEELAEVIRRAQWQPRFYSYRPGYMPTVS